MEDVRRALATGELVEDYPDDTPYPSRLLMAWCGGRPIHLVVAYNDDEHEYIVITVYEPDPRRWDATYRRRTR